MTNGILRPVMMVLGAVLLLAVRAPHAFAATAVSSCGTIPTAGDYVLTKNLTSTGTCFVINVSGVAIDFKSHTIIGNGTGDGIDDGGTAIQNIVIANGTINGFSRGISFQTVVPGNRANVAINNMKVLNNPGDRESSSLRVATASPASPLPAMAAPGSSSLIAAAPLPASPLPAIAGMESSLMAAAMSSSISLPQTTPNKASLRRGVVTS
jgi:hypothetical protein